MLFSKLAEDTKLFHLLSEQKRAQSIINQLAKFFDSTTLNGLKCRHSKIREHPERSKPLIPESEKKNMQQQNIIEMKKQFRSGQIQ